MEQEYVVQEGDNLSTILYNLTGDGSYEHATQVAEQNGISNPSHIEPGQTIRINTSSSSTNSTSTTSSNSTSTQGPTVGSNDGGQTSRSTNSNTSQTTANNTGHPPLEARQVAYEDTAKTSQTTTSQISDNSSNSVPTPKTTAATGSVNGIKEVTGGDKTFSEHQVDSRLNTSSASSTSTPSNSTTESSSQGRGTTFSYGVDEDDSIEYNVEEARKILVGALDPDIEKICGIITNICNTLGDLQKIAHDKENTNIAQDYIDFQTIIGDDISGLNGFVADAFDVCVSVYDTINEWERITQK